VAIRARMEELRRERADVTVDDEPRRPEERPRPYTAGRPSLPNKVGFPSVIIRRLSG